MMKKLFFPAVFGFLILLSLPLVAGGSGGTDDIFSFGAGARAISMGRTFVGLADDVNAIYWNPAGIYNIDSKTVSVFYSQLFEGSMYGFIGYVHPTADYGNFGFGVMTVYTGDLISYDSSSYAYGTFSSARFKFLVSYANQLPWFPLSFGVSVKMNVVSIEEYSGSSFNFDLSLQYDFIKRSLRDKATGKGNQDTELVAGFVFRNLFHKSGERLNLEEDEENYQIVFGVSLMKRITREVKGRMVVDFLLHEQRSPTVSLGAETHILDMFSVRLGYALQSGFSFGGGVKLQGWDIDYALAFRDLGATHNFSVTWKFGESRVDILRAREEAIRKRIRKNVLRERKDQETKYTGIIRKKDDTYSKNIKEKDNVIRRKDQMIADIEKRRREQIRQAEKRIRDLKQRSDEQLARYRKRLDDTIKQNEKQIRELKEQREAAIRKMQEDTRKQIQSLRDSYTKRMDSLEKDYKRQMAGISMTNRMERERLTRRFLREKGQLKQQEEVKSKEYVKGLELYNKALYTQALVHFRAVVRMDPNYAEARLYINKILAQSRNIASYSDKIRSYYRQGVGFYLAGQYQRAIAIWQEILKLDPYNKLAHKNIEMARKRIEFLKKYSR